jgi:hypothetical protein
MVKELLKRFGTSYRLKFFVAVTTKVIEVLFNLLTPIVVARMIDEGVARNDVAVVLRLCVVLVRSHRRRLSLYLGMPKNGHTDLTGYGNRYQKRHFFHTINHVGGRTTRSIWYVVLVTRCHQ